MKKIIVAGKGGAGKSTFISLLTLGLVKANPDIKILLIDADPSANVLLNFGINDAQKGAIGEIEIDENDPDKGRKFLDLFKTNSLQSIIIDGKNVDYAYMGHHERNSCLCWYNNLLNDLLKLLEAENQYDFILIDREAGVEHINRSVYSGEKNNMFILTWPTVEYLTVARDILELTNILGSTGNKALIINNFINVEIAPDKLNIMKSKFFQEVDNVFVMPHMKDNNDFMERITVYDTFEDNDVRDFINKCIKLIND